MKNRKEILRKYLDSAELREREKVACGGRAGERELKLGLEVIKGPRNRPIITIIRGSIKYK